jgi:hypothetical protein
MKIGKRTTLGELDSTGWERFAKDAGISWPLVRQRVGEIAEKIDAKIAPVATAMASLELDPAVVNELATLIGGRVAPCVASATK